MNSITSLRSVRCLFAGVCLLCSMAGVAQYEEIYPRGTKSIRVPFTYENGFIIVSVTLNRTFPLRFIFDTGAENTIITKPEIATLLRMPLSREFTVQGSDHQREMTAYLTRNVRVHVGDVHFPRQSLLVMKEDYFRFEEFCGVRIDGILGGSMFNRQVIKIDYQRGVITFTRADRFEPPPKYESIPIDVYRNKPYIEAGTELVPGQPVDVRLLLDSGAALPMLLYTETHPGLDLPERVLRGNIGQGLGGFLTGFLGRSEFLRLGDFSVGQPLTYFQELPPGTDTVDLNDRNGLIGNDVLSKFHVIIDYPKERLFLLPNRNYQEPSTYDRSGLILISGGANFNQFRVYGILPGSPAAEAGLLPNDQILAVNGLPAELYSLNGITKILKRKPGKIVRLRVRRGGRILRHRLTLRDLI